MIKGLFLILIFCFVKPEDINLELITVFEGKIDKENLPKLTTHLRINNKEYIIVNPKFEEANGIAKIKIKLEAVYKNSELTVLGDVMNELKGNGSLALHV